MKGPVIEALLDGAAGRQYAALPFRYLHGLEVMLISSRETGRWVIPKGWPMKGRKPHAAAAREALQEAGLVGQIGKRSIGCYHYVKRLKNGAPMVCTVEVFPLMVTRQRQRWREQNQRVVRWFPAEEAATMVEEPELQSLIDEFAWSPVRAAHDPSEDADDAAEAGTSARD